MIQSIAGLLAHGALSNRRPFRAPHHSASMAALVGVIGSLWTPMIATVSLAGVITLLAVVALVTEMKRGEDSPQS